MSERTSGLDVADTTDAADRPPESVLVYAWPGTVSRTVVYRPREVAMRRMIRAINGRS